MRNLNTETLLAITNRMEKFKALSMDPSSTRLGSSMYELLSLGYKLLLKAAASQNRDLYYEVSLMRELIYLQGQVKQLSGMSRAERENCVASYEYGVSEKLALLG